MISNMYKTIETVINEGNFVLSELLAKIDYFFAKGSLAESEYEELKEKARSHAEPSNEADLFAKVRELEERVKKLESNNTGNAEATVEEFVSGRWYYNGDKCKEEGIVYTCIAPEGVACVWSPSDYPSYWRREA